MDAYYTCKLIFGFLGAFAQEFGVGYLEIDGLATGLLPISSLTTPRLQGDRTISYSSDSLLTCYYLGLLEK